MNAKQKKQTASNASKRVLAATDFQVNMPEARTAPEQFALWVRVLRQNGRQGTVACKGRSDVARTNKKPWKQKGTGRARAGSARSPLWRGGGIIFGPQPRVRTLKISKQCKQNVLNSLFFDYLAGERINVINWQLENDRPKTSAAFAALKGAGLHTEKVALFLTMDDALTAASFANIPNVQLLSFDEPNAISLAYNTHWAVLEKDLERFKEMVSQWS
jgi:large subunit ribosomal protein L4